MDTPITGLESRRVLLVDDDEYTLALLADFLSIAGYEVSTARSGAQACVLLESHNFPVVVTDYQMPAMDGLQLTDCIRRVDRSSYVIVWSIRSAEEDRNRGLWRGADDYVSKTASLAELMARIEAGFRAVRVRAGLERARLLRVDARLTTDVDSEAWNTAASRLHAEMVRAARQRQPLTVLMLYVECALDEAVCDTVALAPLAMAIGRVIRHHSDWVAPLDVAAGLARLLIVLPDTDAHHAAAVGQRVQRALLEASLTDGLLKLPVECALGVTTFEPSKTSAMNAAQLIAQTEGCMQRSGLPELLMN